MQEGGSLHFVVFVLLLAFAVPTSSFSEPLISNNLTFGDVPRPEMICTGGICPGDAVPPGRIFYAKYQFPADNNFFGQVPVLRPTYDFFEDGLFRIRFEVTCAPGFLESCISEIRSALEEQGFLFVEENWNYQKRTCRGENESGQEAIISSETDTNPSKAFAAIQDKELIEKLRRRANPRRALITSD